MDDNTEETPGAEGGVEEADGSCEPPLLFWMVLSPLLPVPVLRVYETPRKFGTRNDANSRTVR